MDSGEQVSGVLSQRGADCSDWYAGSPKTRVLRTGSGLRYRREQNEIAADH